MPITNPLADKLVTIFGGSGFIGRHVAEDLLQHNARVRIASRNPEEAFSLKPLAKLGQLQFARCNLLDETSVRACVEGSHAVVNLVGSFEGDLMKLMGEAAGALARAAKETGAQNFVQISAIGADRDGESEYARAKALGEELVRDAFPGATILRPSILFGPDGGILQMFAGLISSLPVLPVFAPEAPLQLVHVDDVAAAIAKVLVEPAVHAGKTYELAGPDRWTMLDLNRRIAGAQRRKRTFLPMPDRASAAFAALPGTPMNKDQWRMLQQGSIADGSHPGLDALGIQPRPLELVIDRYMVHFRKHGRFADKLDTAR
ncbi:complex I NDUFA9 subunit family protein [Alteriqipengyuania lutimaris]|uniref:Complex I NDUFA9 subunit family protein n=1 Tax=Alteriqipengyuania lutimaris TaxID=1538146 RepID=A0A395LJH6_9SPHN|nr:complex I NDUFA9 subunit family protein [Alteriqipengyuania lutimaris]MBB3034673.1 NADH dehydrogenase [Alteriqipengyuania lutimaris]RDS76467.1 complex I NDUFA9 subunit family protein [Alteriqipengyuania lutimaris]